MDSLRCLILGSSIEFQSYPEEVKRLRHFVQTASFISLTSLNFSLSNLSLSLSNLSEFAERSLSDRDTLLHKPLAVVHSEEALAGGASAIDSR